MASRKKGTNRRKKQGKSKQILLLLAVVILIALAFFLLERLRTSQPEKAEEKPAAVERKKLPPRDEGDVTLLHPYTTAVKSSKPAPRKKPGGPGTVAIIVDDMGSSMKELRDLIAIRIPLTFSIIPGLAKGREVAEAAHRQGYEVMLHIPMEPVGYPQQRLEANGLLLTQDHGEVERRMRGYLNAVPHVVGANNHMGSRYTEDAGKMRTVLGVLRENEMFFVDSRTSQRSVGYSLAGEMGLAAGTRNVFLDNVQDVEAIRKQLDELGMLARRRGSAIGICHPRRTTIQALTAILPAMERDGIRFVYASELVR